jgi:hypothetical protein
MTIPRLELRARIRYGLPFQRIANDNGARFGETIRERVFARRRRDSV